MKTLFLALPLIFFTSCIEQKKTLITYSHQVTPEELAYWQIRPEIKKRFTSCFKEVKILLDKKKVTVLSRYTFDPGKQIITCKSEGTWKTDNLNLVFDETSGMQSWGNHKIPSLSHQKLIDEAESGKSFLRNGQRVFELDFSNSKQTIFLTGNYEQEVKVSIETVDKSFEISFEN